MRFSACFRSPASSPSPSALPYPVRSSSMSAALRSAIFRFSNTENVCCPALWILLRYHQSATNLVLVDTVVVLLSHDARTMIYEPVESVRMAISMTNIDELFVCFLSFMSARTKFISVMVTLPLNAPKKDAWAVRAVLCVCARPSEWANGIGWLDQFVFFFLHLSTYMKCDIFIWRWALFKECTKHSYRAFYASGDEDLKRRKCS